MATPSAIKQPYVFTSSDVTAFNAGDAISPTFKFPSTVPGTNYVLSVEIENVSGVGSCYLLGVRNLGGDTVTVDIAAFTVPNIGDVIQIHFMMLGVQ
jgi:hypothetical protein